MLPGQESVEHPYIFSVAVEQLVRLPGFLLARCGKRRPKRGKPGVKSYRPRVMSLEVPPAAGI